MSQSARDHPRDFLGLLWRPEGGQQAEGAKSVPETDLKYLRPVLLVFFSRRLFKTGILAVIQVFFSRWFCPWRGRVSTGGGGVPVLFLVFCAARRRTSCPAFSSRRFCPAEERDTVPRPGESGGRMTQREHWRDRGARALRCSSCSALCQKAHLVSSILLTAVLSTGRGRVSTGIFFKL